MCCINRGSLLLRFPWALLGRMLDFLLMLISWKMSEASLGSLGLFFSWLASSRILIFFWRLR